MIGAKRTAALLAHLVIMGWAPAAHAYREYAALLPNVLRASCNGVLEPCITCHKSPCGGFYADGGNCASANRSSFGRDFCSNNKRWDLVYNLDSDGDTFTNGEELLRPSASGPKLGTTNFTDPSDALSMPNECLIDAYNDCVGPCENRTGRGYTCRCDFPLLGDGTEGGTGCRNPGTCGIDLCGDNGTCVPGSAATGDYSCACDPGYEDNGRTCQDIDGCDLNPCGIGGMRCYNLAIGYSCDCYPGYAFDQTTCAIVDQCQSDPCGPGVQTCRTIAANEFRCTCRSGFHLAGGVCVADPACSSEPCGTLGTCREDAAAPSRYTCECNEGFVFDQGTCNDRDECADATTYCGSDASCQNSFGGFTCTCAPGYTLQGSRCKDVNECAEGTDACHPDAGCTNTVGGYECDCREGFRGSGQLCVDIDECRDGLHACGAGSICENTRGDYECSCPPDFSPRKSRMKEVRLECVEICGDGRIGPNEECDDANDESDDGCDRCEVDQGWVCSRAADRPSACSESCGDGWIDPNEECDDGDLNSDDDSDACRTDCTWSSCGDGVVDTGERCDPGADRTCDRHCGVPVEDAGPASSGPREVDAGDPDPPDASPDTPVAGFDAGDAGGGDAAPDSDGCSVAGVDANAWPVLALLLLQWQRRRRARR